jgi:hypothetical protein
VCDFPRGAPRDFSISLFCRDGKNERLGWHAISTFVKLTPVQEPPLNYEGPGDAYPFPARSAVFSPGPDDPPWTSPAALAVWFFSVLAIVLLPNLFVLPYVQTQNIPFDDSARLVEFLQTDPTAILLNLTAVIPAHALTILAAWVVVTKFAKFRFLDMLGWKLGGMKWWHFPVIVVGFFAVALVASHYIPEKENDILKIIRSSRAAV